MRFTEHRNFSRFPGRIFSDHCSTLISLELWRQLYLQRVKFGMIDGSPGALYPESNDPRGECPAVEVMKFRSPEGYYAQSHLPRYNRYVAAPRLHGLLGG